MIYRFATLFLFTFLLYIPSAHTQTFCRTLGTTANDESSNIIPTNDGGYAMVGSIQANGWDVYVVKLSATGDVEWKQTIGGGASDDRGFDIVQTS
ncbi:MAG: hypothetical protein ACE5DN_06655, partial [Flavobacteriales bacterium]